MKDKIEREKAIENYVYQEGVTMFFFFFFAKKGVTMFQSRTIQFG